MGTTIEASFELRNEFAENAIILSAPHSGRRIPEAFLSRSSLGRDQLLATADLGTNRLVQETKITSISSIYARTIVDLNRGRNELDPSVIEGAPPIINPKIRAGYGVIPRFASMGHLVHHKKLTLAEAESRLVTYYDPYHSQLTEMLETKLHSHSTVLLIDVHSAPEHSVDGYDLILGTYHGRSISSAKVSIFEEFLASLGVKSRRDHPFSGGYITQNYSQLDGVIAMQIEINRKHYHMDDGGFCLRWSKIWQKVANGLDLLI